jgi:hypothetical protein
MHESSLPLGGHLPPVMHLSIASLPPELSWLHPAYRPTDQEIDAYAHIIANAEGIPGESSAERLHREAELQLWIWRTENRQPLIRRRPADAPASRRRSPPNRAIRGKTPISGAA